MPVGQRPPVVLVQDPRAAADCTGQLASNVMPCVSGIVECRATVPAEARTSTYWRWRTLVAGTE
ncbi:hypothetical protein PWJ43_02085 [Streptomyces sp. BE230]|nr:hypothetical protein [Streptomyces sp. BE230]